MARQYPYDTSADALLQPAKNAVFFEDWTAGLDELNDDLLCAEMARLAYAEPPIVAAALAKIGFAPVGFFGGETLAARVATRGTEGFVATNAGRGVTVVAFRGTESTRPEDILSDIATWQIDHPRGGRVHRGFHQAYASVHDTIAGLLTARASTLLLTGHSLGAALATLAAIEFSPTKLITFGSPRVGDPRFCAHLQPLASRGGVRRFVGCCDIVARVPPERFDRERLEVLFRDLDLAGAAAQGLARGIDALSPELDYAHVAPARYIAFDGTVHDAQDAPEITRDQEAARRAYPHSTRANLAQATALLAALRAAPTNRDALREFGRGVFGLVRGDPVPRRDLADHAPINYLSGITGRSPSGQSSP